MSKDKRKSEIIREVVADVTQHRHGLNEWKRMGGTAYEYYKAIGDHEDSQYKKKQNCRQWVDEAIATFDSNGISLNDLRDSVSKAIERHGGDSSVNLRVTNGGYGWVGHDLRITFNKVSEEDEGRFVDRVKASMAQRYSYAVNPERRKKRRNKKRDEAVERAQKTIEDLEKLLGGADQLLEILKERTENGSA